MFILFLRVIKECCNYYWNIWSTDEKMLGDKFLDTKSRLLFSIVQFKLLILIDCNWLRRSIGYANIRAPHPMYFPVFRQSSFPKLVLQRISKDSTETSYVYRFEVFSTSIIRQASPIETQFIDESKPICFATCGSVAFRIDLWIQALLMPFNEIL